jgi:trans-aconitate methyltransferase
MLNQKVNKNNSTQYYDIVYKDWIPPQKTQLELSLISSLAKPPDPVIDLGCGTGRHTIPLLMLGFQVTAIDQSTHMLKLLKTKLNQVIKSSITTHTDLYQIKPTNHFQLVILMWNAIHEIANNQANLERLFKKLHSLLKPNGCVLINFHDGQDFQPDSYHHQKTTKHQNKSYHLDWKLLDFNPKSSTSRSQEIITVKDSKNKLLDQTKSITVQHWWSKQELVNTAKHTHFTTKLETLPYFDDLYLILTKN